MVRVRTMLMVLVRLMVRVRIKLFGVVRMVRVETYDVMFVLLNTNQTTCCENRYYDIMMMMIVTMISIDANKGQTEQRAFEVSDKLLLISALIII